MAKKKKSTRPAKVKRVDARDEAIKNTSASFDRSVEDFRKFVGNFGIVNEEFAEQFKKTLNHTERSQIEVHAAATKIQKQFESILFSMSEAGQSFSSAGKYLGDIIRTKVEDALTVNRSEAKEIRKDIESLRVSAAKLHGEERKKIESLIDTASDQLKQVTGGVSIFKETILRRFDPASMIEKMLGGGMIGGIFGDMFRVKQERKKSAALIAMQTEARANQPQQPQQPQQPPQGEQVYDTFQDDIKTIVSSVKTQRTKEGIDTPIDTDLETEEKEREAARRLKKKGPAINVLGGKAGRGFREALQQAMLKFFAFTKIMGWLGPVFAFLFTGLKFFVLKPLFVKLPLLIHNSMLKPLGLLLYNSMLKPLGLLLY
ncbi:TPA: hypothetical protein HA278_00435, partial [Candidatus Woesearchaeota archaeon]|nr:hypothetical protein [Candidatus Woesearchaeota archaeon]